MPRAMKYKKPTREEIIREGAKYAGRTELKENDHRIFYAAKTQGLLDELYPPRKNYTKRWSEETLAEEALKYKTRGEFYKGSPGAYQSARNMGILDEVCSHMTKGKKSDFNMVYIAKTLDDEDTYKIGVTSQRLGFNRFEQLKRPVRPILMISTTRMATELEAELLNIGTVVDDPTSMEYRRWTEDDRKRAMELMLSWV